MAPSASQDVIEKLGIDESVELLLAVFCPEVNLVESPDLDFLQLLDDVLEHF